MTDGQPAALSLARLSMRKYGDGAIAGDELLDPVVLYEYLNHEVFSEFSERERAVMVCAAVTLLVTGDLANAIVDIPESGEILRELATKNRMLRRVSTDLHGRTWYSVQPLCSRHFCAKQSSGMFDQDRPCSTSAARAAEWQSPRPALHSRRCAWPLNRRQHGRLVESILRQRVTRFGMRRTRQRATR